jgi:glycosyltransferase involved in cell wall biosynthesis
VRRSSPGAELRLLLLNEAVYPDFIGGVETRNAGLAQALVRRGHEVTLAGFCGPLPSEPPTLRVLSLGPSPRLYTAIGRRSTRQALRFARSVSTLDLTPFDIVETANMPYAHLVPLAARCARRGKPLLITWYEYWGRYWPSYVGTVAAPAYRLFEWITAHLGAVALATSRLTQERLQTRRHGRIELLPCGIDVARVARAAAAGAEERQPPLVFAGRLLTHKRLNVLLEAVSGIASTPGMPSGPLLTIFGEGPDRVRLESLAGALGIAARVRFRGHVAASEDVWQALGGARIAVQPSAREGFGLFPLEAMAAGLPVVHCSSSESAVGELVRHGIDGWATAPDPSALGAALMALLRDEPRRRVMATAACTRAAAYDYSVIAERFEVLCDRLAGTNPHQVGH